MRSQEEWGQLDCLYKSEEECYASHGRSGGDRKISGQIYGARTQNR